MKHRTDTSRRANQAGIPSAEELFALTFRQVLLSRAAATTPSRGGRHIRLARQAHRGNQLPALFSAAVVAAILARGTSR